MFGVIQHYIYIALAIGAFAFEAFAFLGAMRFSSRTFDAVGKRSKKFWGLILGAAALVGFLGLPPPLGLGITGPLSIVGLAAVVGAGVYMATIRPKLQENQQPRGPRREQTGGW